MIEKKKRRFAAVAIATTAAGMVLGGAVIAAGATVAGVPAAEWLLAWATGGVAALPLQEMFMIAVLALVSMIGFSASWPYVRENALTGGKFRFLESLARQSQAGLYLTENRQVSLELLNLFEGEERRAMEERLYLVNSAYEHIIRRQTSLTEAYRKAKKTQDDDDAWKLGINGNAIVARAKQDLDDNAGLIEQIPRIQRGLTALYAVKRNERSGPSKAIGMLLPVQTVIVEDTTMPSSNHKEHVNEVDSSLALLNTNIDTFLDAFAEQISRNATILPFDGDEEFVRAKEEVEAVELQMRIAACSRSRENMN